MRNMHNISIFTCFRSKCWMLTLGHGASMDRSNESQLSVTWRRGRFGMAGCSGRLFWSWSFGFVKQLPLHVGLFNIVTGFSQQNYTIQHFECDHSAQKQTKHCKISMMHAFNCLSPPIANNRLPKVEEQQNDGCESSLDLHWAHHHSDQLRDTQRHNGTVGSHVWTWTYTWSWVAINKTQSLIVPGSDYSSHKTYPCLSVRYEEI